MEQDGAPGYLGLPIPAEARHKIARLASDPANPYKTRSTDKSARRRGYGRRGGEHDELTRLVFVRRPPWRTAFATLASAAVDGLQNPFPCLDGCDSHRYS